MARIRLEHTLLGERKAIPGPLAQADFNIAAFATQKEARAKIDRARAAVSKH